MEPLPVHLRVPSATWIPAAGWAMLAFLAVDALVRGSWAAFVLYAPGLALAAWLLYVVFWAPRIVVTDDAAVLRNLWTTLTIPYPRIIDIAIALSVRLTYRDNDGRERRISSWNAPGMTKLGRTAFRRHTDPHAQDAPQVSPSAVLLDVWERHADDADSPVVRTPNWVTILGTILLAGVNLWVYLP